MGIEIEKKFLVRGNTWRQGQGVLMRQGYLSLDPERTVRVRIADQQGFLTIKGKSKGLTRPEFEYEIPLRDALELLALCQGRLLEKKRYRIPVEDVVFEVDEFLGDNKGLILAEVELQNELQGIPNPDWLGEEVTADVRYFNSNLVQHPFTQW